MQPYEGYLLLKDLLRRMSIRFNDSVTVHKDVFISNRESFSTVTAISLLIIKQSSDLALLYHIYKLSGEESPGL